MVDIMSSKEKAMSGPSREKGDAVLEMKKKYKYDFQLEINPSPSLWRRKIYESDIKITSTFPYLLPFISLACIAYKSNRKLSSGKSKPSTSKKHECGHFDEFHKVVSLQEGVMSTEGTGVSDSHQAEKEEDWISIPEGFEFLAEAENKSLKNGYYGVAHICWDKRQIIVSHRGTKLSNLGALWTDVRSVWWNSYSSQLSSAITFAYKVAQFAQQTNCQIFFTGHSLGAWLAAVTCFSAKYLTLSDTGHFVRKPSGEWDSLHPYTVAFDSPGALQFLTKMKDDLFPRNDPQSQMKVNVSCLPVEVYQFHTNLVNSANTQVGSVYLVNLAKKEVKYSYAFIKMKVKMPKCIRTHFKEPVWKILSEKETGSEVEVLRSRVIDWRIEKWDDFLHRWRHEGRSVPVELHTFPQFFLSTKEIELLKDLEGKVGEGAFEGLSYEQEEIANRILQFARSTQHVFVDGCIQLGTQLDRREVIPLVRHFADTLRIGSIWWDPRKPQLPSNHIPMKICRSRQFRCDGSLLPSTETLGLSDVVLSHEELIPLVDNAGMGKSTAFTELELQLKSLFTLNRIILRINLNEVQTGLRIISLSESASVVLHKLAPFIPLEALQLPQIRLFVLLDGLDEVCPTHQQTMISLLRTLTSRSEPNHIQVVVSSRRHLKEAFEEEFNVESFSLLPFSPEQQTDYLEPTLLLSREAVINTLSSVDESFKGLLRNPLMLSMIADVLKSEENPAASDLNMFDLYSRFVALQHKLQLVQKEGMEEDNNFTEIRLESVFSANLPVYHRVAIKELEVCEFLSAFGECRSIAEEVPVGLTRAELLSFGLLVEDSSRGLVFKHRSFAEFFFARLLLQSETPQGVKDILFGCFYRGIYVLENVEAFLIAALSKKTAKAHLRFAGLNENESKVKGVCLHIRLSSKWLLIKDHQPQNFTLLFNFVRSGIFPFAVGEVLMTFVREDKDAELFPPFLLLVNSRSRVALTSLYGWMAKNKDWTRNVLFEIQNSSKTFSQPAARLIVAISMIFGSQSLFNAGEIKTALESCDRILSTVASIQTDKLRKWDFVEGHLGNLPFRELIQAADHFDWWRLIDDVETVRKLWVKFSRVELLSLISNEEMRRSDVIGCRPCLIYMGFGERFLTNLPRFRAKFLPGEEGKTVFELGGAEFALNYFWGKLIGEMAGGCEEGGVTIALREAIGRRAAWEVLWSLEKILRRKRKTPRDHVVEWVVGEGGRLWDSLTLFPLELLPFFIRYSGKLDHVIKAINKNKRRLTKDDEEVWRLLLRSLILASLNRNSGCFDFLSAFLGENVDSAPPNLRTLVEVLVGGTEEKLAASHRPSSLVGDVSLGTAFLALIGGARETVDGATWREVVSDALRFTRCCDLPASLRKLKNVSEKKLQRILLSDEVLFEWRRRVTWDDEKMDDGPLFLRNILEFYFSVFGIKLERLDLAEVGVGLVDGVYRHLVARLPVEILTLLEATPDWFQLAPRFEDSVKEFLADCGIDTVDQLADNVDYKTEDEWVRLIQIGGKENFQPCSPTNTSISCAFAAPLIRAFIRVFGVKEARILVGSIWERISPNVEFPSDSLQSNASVLHSAIQLGEVEWVERFVCPGLVSWKNSERKNAVDVAEKTLGKEHPLSLLLRDQLPACNNTPIPFRRTIPGEATICKIFESQFLFNAGEIKTALESCDRILSTVASIQTDKLRKWDSVEGHLGNLPFRELIQAADHFDWWRIIDNVETVRKLWEKFSRAELLSLISNEEMRRSDVIDCRPCRIYMGFGERFLTNLPRFRAKFLPGEEGKTVFELGGAEFALNYFWGKLIGEMAGGCEEGGVTIALREAIGRRAAWEVLWRLEKILRRKRKTPRDHVVEWVVGEGGRLWNSLTSFPLELLPFFIRYSGKLDHVTKTIQDNKRRLTKDDEEVWRLLLRSLILASINRNSGCFDFLSAFLGENVDSAPPNLRPLVEVLVGSTEEKLAASHRPSSLVGDVSLGTAFLVLIGDARETVDGATWRDVVSDAVRFTRSCDLPASLGKLKNLSEKKLQRILLSDEVLFEWRRRVTWDDEKMDDWPYFLRIILEFYLERLDFGEVGGGQVDGANRHLVARLPVEILTLLEATPDWFHLAPRFEESVKKFLADCGIDTVDKLADNVDYKTEDEWVRLIRMGGKENFQPCSSTNTSISCAFAAPLIRAFIRVYGVKEARILLGSIWDRVSPNVEFPSDSLQSNASVLHSAIQLGEVEWVERFVCPGLVAWRNSERKNAVDVAEKTLGKEHQLSLLLRDQLPACSNTPIPVRRIIPEICVCDKPPDEIHSEEIHSKMSESIHKIHKKERKTRDAKCGIL